MVDRIGTSESPDDVEILQTVMDLVKESIYVCLPGKVEKYDAAKQVADIKPLIKNPVVFEDGEEILESIAVIPNVPVLHPRGGGFYIHLPLKKGDNVTLLFSDRAIDAYMDSSGAVDVDPIDFRAHDITDAIALPGWYTLPRAIKEPLGNSLIIAKEGGGGIIEMKEDGQVSINNHLTVDP